MTQTENTKAPAQLAADSIAALGLSVDSVFIPWSQSRNKAEKSRSLNWSVTLRRNGREILSTDYSAGLGHCPAYKAATKGKPYGRGLTREESDAIQIETETGRRVKFMAGRPYSGAGSTPILPDSVSVIYSLVMDSSVIESGGFESWAADYGYDTDSRKAESTYRECLEHALKLRQYVGESGLESLRQAFQDY